MCSCEFDGPSSRSNRTAWFQDVQQQSNRDLGKYRHAEESSNSISNQRRRPTTTQDIKEECLIS